MSLDKFFTENDKVQVIEFLNFIAQRAVFSDWKTEDSIKHFKLLAHMQQVIIPKIDAHIFEVLQTRKIDETKEVKEPKESRASKK